MALQRYINNFDTQFIAAVKDTATSGTPATELDYGILRVATGAAAALGTLTDGDFYILTAYKRSGSVESNVEIMKVTAIDTSVINETRITVERAQEGTTAQAYVPGDYVSCRFTKGGAAGMLQAAANLGDVGSAATARTNLGLAIGTNVQAWDTDLDWVAANITTAGKALLDDVDAAAQRTTLGLGTAATTASTDYAPAFTSGTQNYVWATPNGSAGVPSLRALVSADIPTLNQNTTGSAATLTTPRAIYGNNFDGSAALTQIIASTYGGTGNGFTKFSGPTTSEKTFTLPDASDTLAALGTAQTWTAVQSFAASGIKLKGSSTGYTTFSSANASATSYTITFPASTGTVLTDAAVITVAQGGTGAATLTGVLKGNGTSAFTAATAGADYSAGTSALATGLLKSTTATGALSIATAGTDYVAPGTATTFTATQTFKGITDTIYTITDGAAFEINPANGAIQVVTLGASRTPAATNFVSGQSVLLGIDDGTAYSITWTNAVDVWVKPGGTGASPTLATSGYTWVLIWKVGSIKYGVEVGRP